METVSSLASDAWQEVEAVVQLHLVQTQCLMQSRRRRDLRQRIVWSYPAALRCVSPSSMLAKTSSKGLEVSTLRAIARANLGLTSPTKEGEARGFAKAASSTTSPPEVSICHGILRLLLR
eukprot:symbB.v1.2.015227.t1/scaffold1133.1/size135993/3